MTKTQPKTGRNAEHFMSPSAVRNFFLWPLYMFAVTAVGLLVATMIGAIWFAPDNDTTSLWIKKGAFVAGGSLLIVCFILLLGPGKTYVAAKLGNWWIQVKRNNRRRKLGNTASKVRTSVDENRKRDKSLRSMPPTEIKRRGGSSPIAKNVPRKSSKKKD